MIILQQTRGSLSSGDQCSLDLPFAETKSLTARVGPTPAFIRASIATFVGSDGLIQSAAVNAARFDHDPVTLACKGLLIEEQRTNLLQRSEEFNNAYWVKFQMQPFGSGSIADTTETLAPDGSNNADKLVENTASDRHQIGDVGPTITVGSYTHSIFLKKPAGSAVSHVMIAFGGVAATGVAFTSLNLTTLEIGNTLGGANANSSAIQYSNGWIHLRCTITTTVAGALNPNVVFSRNGLFANRSYTGDGTSGVYLWGAQLEAGAFATSYIPTVASTLTRSADVCSITGSNFTGFYNQLEGTMLANAFTPASGDRTVLATDDNTANEMIRLRTEGNNPFLRVIDGGSEVVAIDAGTVTANTAFKLIGAYKVNDFASSINGGSAVTDTTGTIPAVDRMRIGAGQSGNTMCGCISAIRYYRKRLSNAKLQAITV